jgi:two-component system cell cycle sensor histidine kinase/response regulator CckA
MMPGMTGPELVEIIRKQFPNIQVIFISGYTNDDLGDSILLDQSIIFLQKPFPINVLVQKVKNCLDESK